MLHEISLRGLGVIEEAVLELGPGFTVLTGETGAGKTMVLHGLGLLFGARGDAGAVRVGSARTVVEGRLTVPPADTGWPARLEELGAVVEDGTLLVTRSVAAEGRSRCTLGGVAVPAATLAELATDVVAVHGQSDQQRLLRSGEQRLALDRFGGPELQDALVAYQRHWVSSLDNAAALREAETQDAERGREAGVLADLLPRVEALAPTVGEEDRLRTLIERLGHAEALAAAASTARDAVLGDDDATGAQALTALAAKAVHNVAAHDPALAALGARLADLGYQLGDVGADIARYAADVEVEPAVLVAAHDRLAALRALVIRLADYGVEDCEGVVAWARQTGTRLAELADDGARRDQLRAQRDQIAGQLATAAAALTRARVRAADSFSVAVTGELGALAMPDAQLSAHVTPTKPGSHGADEVELMLAAHRGAPTRPLHRGASGGELSRVMLAVEVVFAGADPVATLVFDEVDAGVGGRAAVEVGRRLARLARDHQVLVVTHLPQVAAFADRHVRLTKDSAGQVTATGVAALDGPGRVSELARMLAGLEDSSRARAHAEELLALVASERAGWS